MTHEEAKIQAACVQLLNGIDWAWIFMVKNDGRKSMQASLRDKAMGLRSGVTDTVLMTKWGESVYIEVKTATGVLSSPQKEFKKRCEDWGHKWFLVRSVSDMQNVLEKLDREKKP